MKLLDLNVQNTIHLARVIPFIQKELPDIITLQEVDSENADMFKKITGMDGLYVPSVFIDITNSSHRQLNRYSGSMTLTKYPTKYSTFYYNGDPAKVPSLSQDLKYFNYNRFLIIADFETGGKKYKIINTHFTWAPNGGMIPLQSEHMEAIFKKLDTLDEFIFCGDFNAPRGGQIWQTLADRYKDNIPPEVTTTLDQNLHRAKNLQHVVDGLFSTPAYQISNVKVIDGVSDHQAIVATIERR